MSRTLDTRKRIYALIVMMLLLLAIASGALYLTWNRLIHAELVIASMSNNSLACDVYLEKNNIDRARDVSKNSFLRAIRYYLKHNRKDEEFHHLLGVIHQQDLFDSLGFSPKERSELREYLHANPEVMENYIKLREQAVRFGKDTSVREEKDYP